MPAFAGSLWKSAPDCVSYPDRRRDRKAPAWAPEHTNIFPTAKTRAHSTQKPHEESRCLNTLANLPRYSILQFVKETGLASATAQEFQRLQALWVRCRASARALKPVSRRVDLPAASAVMARGRFRHKERSREYLLRARLDFRRDRKQWQ